VHDVAAPLIDGELGGHQENTSAAGDRLGSQRNAALLVGAKGQGEHAGGVGASNQDNKDCAKDKSIPPQRGGHGVTSSVSSHGVSHGWGTTDAIEYTGMIKCCKFILVLWTFGLPIIQSAPQYEPLIVGTTKDRTSNRNPPRGKVASPALPRRV